MLDRVRLSNCAVFPVFKKDRHNFIPFSCERDVYRAYQCQFCSVSTFSNFTGIALTQLGTVRIFSQRLVPNRN